jgi:hypothetical protein
LLKAARDLQRGHEPPEPRRGYDYRVHPIADLMHCDVSFEEVARSAMANGSG